MKKNLNSVIANSILAALGVLFVCFMAGNYIPGGASGYWFLNFLKVGFSLSGYSMLYMLLGLGTLVSLIAMILVAVLAVLNILVALNVIKKPGLAKVFSKVASILAVIALAGVVMIFSGCFALTEAAYFGWALILNTVLALAAVVVTFYCKVVAKKAAKQAAKESKE